MSDPDQLIQAYRGGDETAFEQLVHQTEFDLRCFVLARCRQPEQVEEIVQFAYVTAFERLEDYRLEGRFRSWLKGIARNRWLEIRRENQRQSTRFEAVLDQLWQEQVADSDEWLQQRLRRMRYCLTRLPEQARTLLLRHHVDGLSLARLAQQFRKKSDVLAKRLFDTRRRLRQCVEAEHV
jgi:RNA polymerase sigma-70 factor, ECF subfamily